MQVIWHADVFTRPPQVGHILSVIRLYILHKINILWHMAFSWDDNTCSNYFSAMTCINTNMQETCLFKETYVATRLIKNNMPLTKKFSGLLQQSY